jgi:hypothetical protein
LKAFKCDDKKFAAYWRQGKGGNPVAVFSAFNMVVVITTTNYNIRGAHLLSDRRLFEDLLAAGERWNSFHRQP